jgi:transcriptional regulator with XRE-family HTH domain
VVCEFTTQNTGISQITKLFCKKVCIYLCISIIFCNFASYFKMTENGNGFMNERERIEKVKETLGLTARQFAAEIRVQPGTISNMMAGRNNPSLEVMKRIMERYPTLNPEWLIAGRGEMWRTEPGQDPGLFDGLAPDPKTKTARSSQKEEPQVIAAPQKKISRIVVYYTDNTYEEFRNSGI